MHWIWCFSWMLHLLTSFKYSQKSFWVRSSEFTLVDTGVRRFYYIWFWLLAIGRGICLVYIGVRRFCVQSIYMLEEKINVDYWSWSCRKYVYLILGFQNYFMRSVGEWVCLGFEPNEFPQNRIMSTLWSELRFSTSSHSYLAPCPACKTSFNGLQIIFALK